MSNFRLSVTGNANKLFVVLLNVVIAVVVAVAVVQQAVCGVIRDDGTILADLVK